MKRIAIKVIAAGALVLTANGVFIASADASNYKKADVVVVHVDHSNFPQK